MIGKKRALVVGINDYADPTFATLKFAVNDAQEVATVLKDQNVGEFSEVVCLDRAVSKFELERRLAYMMQQAEPDDLVLVYFAGHGMLDSSQQLCLVTANTEAAVPFWTGVPLENIDRMVKDSRCKSVVLMLDCCYSGPKNEAFRGNGLVESLSQFSDQENSTKIVISAAQGEEVARELDALDHGVFTHYLLKGLAADADEDRDGYVSIEELFTYVSRSVALETNNKQKPAKYPSGRISGIRLAKSPSTLAELQKAQEEIEQSLDKLTEIWAKDEMGLEEDIYYKARNVLRDQSLSFGNKKRRSLVTHFLNEAINKTATKNFVDDFKRLEEMLEGQAGALKLAGKVGSARVEEKPNTAATEAQRASPAVEVRSSDRGGSEIAGTSQSRLNLPTVRDPQQQSTPIRDLVFISYSRDNEVWLERLRSMLHPLSQNGLNVWSDRDIRPGALWFSEIQEKLKRTKVAVLLVTDTFISSDFINKVELPEFHEGQEKGLTILWVLVSPCRWDSTKIARYQAAYTTEKPLIKMSEADQLTALEEISRVIEKAAAFSAAAAGGSVAGS